MSETTRVELGAQAAGSNSASGFKITGIRAQRAS